MGKIGSCEAVCDSFSEVILAAEAVAKEGVAALPGVCIPQYSQAYYLSPSGIASA